MLPGWMALRSAALALIVVLATLVVSGSAWAQ
jgi:hypothetical protein